MEEWKTVLQAHLGSTRYETAEAYIEGIDSWSREIKRLIEAGDLTAARKKLIGRTPEVDNVPFFWPEDS